DWRAIFWINLGAGIALAAGIRLVRHRGNARDAGGDAATNGVPDDGPHRSPAGGPDVTGALLAVAAVAAAVLAVVRPRPLAEMVAWGWLAVPVAGSTGWTTPLTLLAAGLAVAFLVRELTARRPFVDPRRLPGVLRAADVPGAILLAAALGAIVLTFAVADPEVELIDPAGPWLLGGAAAALSAFAWRQRRARVPLVPAAAVRPRPAWGSLLVSLLVGAALVAVLVDVPVMARTVVPGSDQLDAALLLLRFLVAVPLGALLGGWLLRWLSP